MHVRRFKMGWLPGIVMLAAGMMLPVKATSAQKMEASANAAGVPANPVQHGKSLKSKGASSSPREAKKKTSTRPAAKKIQSQEISALKQQLAVQQKQIRQLLQAVETLNARLGSAAKKEAPTAENSPAAPPESAEVASLAPVLPPQAKAQSKDSGQLTSLNTALNRVKTAIGTAIGSNAPSSAPAEAEKHQKLGPIAAQDIKVGATFFGNFSHYTGTGYAPAFQDLPTTQLTPGNSGLNTFEVTRGYINIFYSPSDKVTLRITPDIYRESNGSLSYRLKYGFVDVKNIFGNGAFKKTKLTFGQTTEPLIDWEESLSGHRYTYLLPWNYLSLSSTYDGVKFHGPIMLNNKEYLDFDIGVFNSTSFHHVETNDRKSVMGRLTVYPFGTTADKTGLGFTVFNDYGYSNTLPNQDSKAIDMFSLLAHYQTHDKGYQIAFEYQLGHNAVSAGNMFSGAGPAAENPFGLVAGTVLGGEHTRQQGFDVFGHARLGHSPFSLWGLYQNFQPNTNFSPSSVELADNPMDFTRTVGGIAYKVTDHFDVAFGDQNFHWAHPQTLAGPDTNGIVVWTQFNY